MCKGNNTSYRRLKFMVTAETVIWPLTSQLYETDGPFALMTRNANNFVINAVSFIFVYTKNLECQ